MTAVSGAGLSSDPGFWRPWNTRNLSPRNLSRRRLASCRMLDLTLEALLSLGPRRCIFRRRTLRRLADGIGRGIGSGLRFSAGFAKFFFGFKLGVGDVPEHLPPT